MDRRTFLTGLGTLGAAAGGTWTSLGPSDGSARAAGLARAAGAPGTDAKRVRALPAGTSKMAGLTMAVLDERSQRWAPWSAAPASMRSFLSLAPGREGRLTVRLGALRAASAAPLVRSLDVVAHFALDDGGFAPFYASSFHAATRERAAMESASIAFDALEPDRMALQVGYVLDERLVAGNVAATGSMYLPVGALDGPGKGFYVLATPSRTTGLPPTLASYRYSGDVHAPIVDAAGEAPDFDYLVLSIAAA
ncbi:MAG TPA: hypothetical protein VFP36_06410 [Usitatibacter sp.]|nr:hypothetical protein [Usitatibacter sp.]